MNTADLLKQHINIPFRISQMEYTIIHQKFNDLICEAQLKWESKYMNCMNYEAYVYLITDLKYNMYYIGVRYTKNKYSDNIFEDLLKYQSSSTDTLFKNRQITNNSEFQYTVLQSFNNEFDAQNYEALLHEIYDVKNNSSFYNRTNAKFLEYLIYSAEIWDIQEQKIVYCNDIQHESKYHVVWGMVKRNNILALNRYCLPSNIEEATKRYKFYNTMYTFYIWNTNKVEEVVLSYQECMKLFGANFYELVNGIRNHVYNYYKHADLCKLHNTYYTFYKFNGIIVEKVIIAHKDGMNIIGTDFHRLIKGEISKNNGYYLTKELCEVEYRLITLYTFIDGNICEITKTYLEWVSYIGGNLSRLFNGKYKVVKGYYINREICECDYKLYTFKNISTNEIKSVRLNECRKEIGPHYTTLINGKRKTFNGWCLVQT